MVGKNFARLPKGDSVTPSLPGGLHVQAVCAKPSLNVHQHASSHEAEVSQVDFLVRLVRLKYDHGCMFQDIL